MADTNTISIHTSLAGSDSSSVTWLQSFQIFQSTLPLREVTAKVRLLCATLHISIHTSLAGSDLLRAAVRERRIRKFQSTLPLREVTLFSIMS